MTDKPILLLDIDGVCNLFPRSLTTLQRAKGDPYPQIRDHEVHRVTLSEEQEHPYMLRIATDLAGLVAQLQGHFEVRWYTMWNDAADSVFAPLAGLPALGHFQCDWVAGREAYYDTDAPVWMDKHIWIAKTPLIEKYIGDRPFVWVDDDSGPADGMFLDAHAKVGEYLIITVEPHLGLTQAVVDEAIDWARTLASHLEEITL